MQIQDARGGNFGSRIRDKYPGSATLLAREHLSLVVVMKVLLLVVVKGVSRGRALLTDVAGEDGHHVVCLDMPRHVVSPTEDVANNFQSF